MPLSLRFGHTQYDDDALSASIESILSATPLLSLATTNEDDTPHINTVFFAFDDKLRLVFLSDPKTRHCRNLIRSPNVAATVFDSRQVFWSPLAGLQLFGDCRQTHIPQLPHALTSFLKRFPAFSEVAKHPVDMATSAISVRFHTFTVTSLKLFDEPRFGEENFVDLSISR